MPKTKDKNEVYLNLKVSKDFKYLLKEQSAREKTTMQDMILRVLKDYCQKKDYLEFEELDEEDLKDLKAGEKAYKEGKYKTFEQVKEELPCQ
ncbi:MAG: hypothetical protein ABRQ39_26445 [Candidatus Eremiobacterota bacterium]